MRFADRKDSIRYGEMLYMHTSCVHIIHMLAAASSCRVDMIGPNGLASGGWESIGTAGSLWS